MLIHRGETAALKGSTVFSVSMRWDSFEDFDLLAVYEDDAGNKGTVYFSEPGSSEKSPYIRLHDDIDFNDLDQENKETITVHSMSVHRIWFLGWAFEQVQNSTALNLADSGLQVSLVQEQDTFETTASDLEEGNICIFGCVQQDKDGSLSFQAMLQCITLPLLIEIEELYSYLPQ